MSIKTSNRTRQPIMVAGKTFKTKTALRDRIRTIVAGYETGETVDPDDFTFLRSLLDRHRERDDKVGPGVASIQVQLDLFGNRCCWLTRVDGSRTDWSWVGCIDPPPRKKDVLSALRTAIVDQVLAFRNSYFLANPEPVCSLTGEPLTLDQCHVDHVAPLTFQVLAERFIEAEGLDCDTVALDGFDDGQTEKTLIDLDLKARWQAFHADHARLRVLSRRGNLSVARKKEPTP